MSYWLVKSDPDAYSWQDLLKDKKTEWDGVRNYQARNNLDLMIHGDKVLVYHSLDDKAVVGLAEVTRESFPDPTTDDDRWKAVELTAIRTLANPVTLKKIKSTDSLSEIALIKQSRLSVMPLTETEFEIILQLSEEE